jgi:hypothetical protein
MKICITIHGKRHCFYVPIYAYPIPIFHGPPPGNYEQLFQDVSIIGSIQSAAAKVSDKGVREALEGGIKAAVLAAKKHADYVESIDVVEQR